MSPLQRFFLLSLSVWLCSWLPLGLFEGDPDYVLTPISRGSWQRQAYQVLFYSGLLACFVHSWKRNPPPELRWQKPSLFVFYLIQGLIASVILRLVLWKSDLASWLLPSKLSPVWLANVILSCFAVALIEEAVFRGFLLGHLTKTWGWAKATWLSSGLFALVHLFRPGTAQFKLLYGIGLLLLGYLLANIARHHRSVWASAGFHAGLIFLNLALRLDAFKPSWLSGWQSEPVSGLVSIVLTLLFLVTWSWLLKPKGTS